MENYRLISYIRIKHMEIIIVGNVNSQYLGQAFDYDGII